MCSLRQVNPSRRVWPSCRLDPTAQVNFDPGTGLSLDGDTVYLTARVGPEAFDGSMVAPEALGVRVLDESGSEEIMTSSNAVYGPG